MAADRLAAVLAGRDERLRAGDRAGAAALLEAALADAALAPVRAALEGARADLRALGRAWEAFDAAAAALAEDARARLRLREGEPVRGRVVAYDAQAPALRVEPPGRREPVALGLGDVHPDDLLALALPAAEGRANALFFLARGLPDAAGAALEAWAAAAPEEAAGEAALRAQVERARAVAREARVASRLDVALAADAAPEALLQVVASLGEAERTTEAYRARAAALAPRWAAARAEQLRAAPERLLRGAVSAGRRGALRVRYTFRRPDELDDWAVDAALAKGASARAGEDGVVVRGALQHLARFQSGELTVALRVTTAEERQPNLNVVLGHRGGWTGVLVGAGFGHGALQSLMLDPTVPRRPPHPLALPAHVVIGLDGRAPRAEGINLAVEPCPPERPGARKVEVVRDDHGAVRLKLRGRDALRAPAPASIDGAGHVAIAPLAAEVVVHEVELTGRLEDAWLAARAREVAEAEAAALTPPR
ncbi:MAG: hypothetical protein M9894_09915 [Planctomycetes bacterium]|nr:hypothetical protein [Planctomycetota bacterium]